MNCVTILLVFLSMLCNSVSVQWIISIVYRIIGTAIIVMAWDVLIAFSFVGESFRKVESIHFLFRFLLFFHGSWIIIRVQGIYMIRLLLGVGLLMVIVAYVLTLRDMLMSVLNVEVSNLFIFSVPFVFILISSIYYRCFILVWLWFDILLLFLFCWAYSLGGKGTWRIWGEKLNLPEIFCIGWGCLSFWLCLYCGVNSMLCSSASLCKW